VLTKQVIRDEPEPTAKQKQALAGLKKGKAQLSRARNLMRAAKWGSSPLDIG